MEWFWHAFIPLFVAFDAVGLLPVYWGLAHGLSDAQRRRAVNEAVGTALGVAVVFLLVARFIFALMGLELADLMIAGGVILIVLTLRDLLVPEETRPPRSDSPGVVPLGVPLLTGPAVLTATCEDYRAGASVDRDDDLADSEAGRKIACPVLVIWGRGYSASAASPSTVWRKWADQVDEVALDCGHFVAEERPRECAEVLLSFFRA